jgi:hypothetical protein
MVRAVKRLRLTRVKMQPERRRERARVRVERALGV